MTKKKFILLAIRMSPNARKKRVIKEKNFVFVLSYILPKRGRSKALKRVQIP